MLAYKTVSTSTNPKQLICGRNTSKNSGSNLGCLRVRTKLVKLLTGPLFIPPCSNFFRKKFFW